MKVSSVFGVTVIDPSNDVVGALLNHYRALWANPGLAVLGIGSNGREHYVFDSALDLGASGASAHRIHVDFFVLRAFALRTARVVAARHLVPVVFVGVR